MYGSNFDFSGVTLPGPGGQINASNSISGEQLKKQNESGKKWRPNADGLMSNHNENILKMNAEHREKRAGLVNREYNENADGKDAMKEIFDRKKARMSSFKEMKKGEYGFAEGDSQDSELLSMPLPVFKEKGKTHVCKGAGCPICANLKYQEMSYREWSTEKRKSLKEGKIKGEFAGPDLSFPIAGPVDVAAAWASVGRAANPRAIMKRIISISKKHGWESGLPESVKKRLAAGESGLPSGDK
jgi:hypothetical protein